MSTVALKINVDGIKYLIKGVSKQTSHKEILCAIAKHRNTDHANDGSECLSATIGSLNIIECNNKKDTKRKTSVASDKLTSRLKRKLPRSQSVKQRSTNTERNRYEKHTRNGNKEKEKEQNHEREKEEQSKKENKVKKHEPRKQSKLSRSLSLNDKDRTKYGRRKSSKPISVDDCNLEKTRSYDRQLRDSFASDNNKDDSLISSDARGFINNPHILQNFEVVKKRQIIAQIKSEKRDSWVESLRPDSITYFIEESRTLLPNVNNGFERSECVRKYENSSVKDGFKKIAGTVSDCTEIDTDSGLPSIGYESSSLDGVSRDVLEQDLSDCDADATSATPEDLRQNSDTCSNCDLGHKSVNRNCDEKGLTSELDEESSKLMSEYNGLWKDLTNTVDELLFSEIMIAQLDFQLECLAEEIQDGETDNADDIELEEGNMVSELRQTREFLKAVTYLTQYQTREHLKNSEEMDYLEQEIRVKRLKYHSACRRLQRMDSLPRHLDVSVRKKRTIFLISESSETDPVDDEINFIDHGAAENLTMLEVEENDDGDKEVSLV